MNQKKNRPNQKKKVVVKLTGLTMKKLLLRLKINPKLMATIKMAQLALQVTKEKKHQTVGLFFKTPGLIFDQTQNNQEWPKWPRISPLS